MRRSSSAHWGVGVADIAIAAEPLRLRLLGGFTLLQGREEIVLPTSAQRVVALLALRDRPLSRGHLARVLWPDCSAERSLADGANPERVIAMTIQGLKELEWRSQRIRAFDWYTLDYKRQDARELRGHYWEAWAVQVRCYRKAGDTENAGRLLRAMEHRAALLKNTAGPEYTTATETLAGLHAEIPVQ